MIIIFLLIAICAIIVFSTYVNDPKNTVGSITVTSVISCVITAIIITSSYISYLDTRAQYDATIRQYKGAVTMYTDYASLDVEKAALTDFKHQGYQENVAKVIIDLRKEIVEYNEVLIKKRILKKNIFFNWLIIAPDADMKVINIVE